VRHAWLHRPSLQLTKKPGNAKVPLARRNGRAFEPWLIGNGIPSF
jgi:hypothetical protein